MWHRFQRWFASLRTQLIITYVLVTALSFGILAVLLMKPVERMLMQREEDNLAWNAHTLGTTIRTPWRVNEEIWLEDQGWTQRRCRLYVAPMLKARIRLLDNKGNVLTDSRWPGSWEDWLIARADRDNLHKRPEVAKAIHGAYGILQRPEEGLPTANTRLYIARPILRPDPKTLEQRVAFILYIDKSVAGVQRDLARFTYNLKLWMIATLLIMIVAAVLFSVRLSSGLRAATQVAREFADGRMEQRMHGGGLSEVGELSAAFNQMAEALQQQEQLRRALLADVSHELRTPLTAISGCAESLADGALNDDPATTERFLGIIQRESERLRRLVNDILELSKLQAGAVPIPRAPLPVQPLLEDALEIARMQADGGTTLTCAYADGVEPGELAVMGNEDRLAQALRNLLDNALHHAADGGTVAVRVEAAPDEVVIRIHDDGDGISADELPWIFDRFYRGSERKHAGTGLGLAIVREIMLAHGGRVAAESAAGQGTTFSLHLPRVQADVSSPA